MLMRRFMTKKNNETNLTTRVYLVYYKVVITPSGQIYLPYGLPADEETVRV
jgi:hypothetical protein